jgi:integrase
VTKILQAIPASNLRDRALFTLLYDTGIRVGEALSLLATDVDLSTDDEKIRVFGKGQRERTVMLTAAPESVRLLRRHLKQSHITSGSVFRGDPRYGGSSLPLEYSVAHYQGFAPDIVSASKDRLRNSRAFWKESPSAKDFRVFDAFSSLKKMSSVYRSVYTSEAGTSA